MSDTPKTDAAHEKSTDPYVGHEVRDLCRLLERENAQLREVLASVRALGEVYIYPNDWRCAKHGGPPPIDAYEKVDLSSWGEDVIAENGEGET